MDKIMVQRANVILQIPAEDKERFMSQGYSVIDDKGTVLEAAMPQDVTSLKQLVRELQAQIAEKDAEIEKLNKKSAKKVSAE